MVPLQEPSERTLNLFFPFPFGVQECAKRIAKVSADAKLDVDEETYLSQFKPHLMDVVYAWANGSTFAQICKMTDVFEGRREVGPLWFPPPPQC